MTYMHSPLEPHSHGVSAISFLMGYILQGYLHLAHNMYSSEWRFDDCLIEHPVKINTQTVLLGDPAFKSKFNQLCLRDGSEKKKRKEEVSQAEWWLRVCVTQRKFSGKKGTQENPRG